MSDQPESTVKETPAGAWLEFWRRGAESYIAMQKSFLDSAMQQSAAYASAVGQQPATPFLTGQWGWNDWSAKSAEAFAASQKTMLEYFTKQSPFVIGIEKANAAAAEAIAKTAGLYVDTQKKYLDVAVQQSAVALKSLKDAYGMIAASAASGESGGWIKEGIEKFIETQQKFLDLASKQAAISTAAAGCDTGVTAPGAKALAEWAQKGVDAYVDAQKRVLDLAGKQAGLALKAQKETANFAKATPVDEYLDLAQQGVENFADTQKRLLDMAVNS